MYIKSLYIRNFRNFGETTIYFRPRLTVLVGENGAGKSNAIHALRLLLDSSLGRQSRVLDENDFHEVDSVRFGKEVLIAAVFTDFEQNVKDLAYCGRWKTGPNEALVAYRFRPNETVRQEVENVQQLAREAGLTEESDAWPADREFTIDDYEYDRSGGMPPKVLPHLTIFEDLPRSAESDLNKYVVLELPAIRDVVRDMAQRRQSPLVKLIELAALPSDVKTNVEGIIAVANNAIQSDPFFTDLQQKIGESYEDLATAPESLTLRVGLADPSFSSALRSISLLLSDGALEDAEISRNGLGFNNLLYIAILAEYFKRRKADKPGNQLLIVEEPEAHLHPNAQAALIRRLSQNDHQTIATTHSLVAAGAVGSSPLVSVTKTPLGSVARRLTTDANLTLGEQRDLDRYLDGNRAHLLFARKVILVEGISEELILRAVARLRGINLSKSNVALVAVSGTHFPIFEKLFSAGALVSECCIVSDDDAQNKAAWIQARKPDDGALIPHTSVASNVTWYKCKTTLEMALAQPQNAAWISSALSAAGYPVVSKAVFSGLASGDAAKVQIAQLATVRNARRAAKGRFAQLLADSVHRMAELPGYLEALFGRL